MTAPSAVSKAAHTDGPWSACKDGKCACHTVMCADHPIATITSGDWGDDFPSVRLVGDSLDRKAEPYMDQITYGSVDPAVAEANCRLIAAAPTMLEARRGMLREWDKLTRYGSPIAKAANERVAFARAAIAAATGDL